MDTTYLKSFALGAVSGMRSLMAPVFTNEILKSHHTRKLMHSPFKVLAEGKLSPFLRTAALGELVVDKLPDIPDRVEPALLAGRAALGALSGAAFCAMENKQMAIGAATGAAGAIAAAYLFLFLRKKVGKEFKINDTVVGIAEDLMTIGSGLGLIKAAK